MPRAVSTTEARADLLQIIAEVVERKQRFRIIRRGKTVAALVPSEDLERLESEENSRDRADAKRMLKRIRSGQEQLVELAEVAGASNARKRKSLSGK